MHSGILTSPRLKSTWLRLVVAGGAAHSLACGDIVDADPSLGSVRLGVIGGEPSTAAQDGVLKLQGAVADGVKSNCTATLIAPNLLVTALHCVAYFDELAEFECDGNGALSSPPPGGTLGATIDPQTVEVWSGVRIEGAPVAHGKEIFGSGSTQICRNDIAAVVLDRELSLPTYPVRFGSSVHRGDSVQVVGYSRYLEADAGADRHTRRVEVTDVGAVAQDAEQKTGSAGPNSFVVGYGLCFGDSGGPAFSEPDGALVGVYSTSVGISCESTGVRNVFTQVEPFESLINKAAEAAGNAPVVLAGPASSSSKDTAEPPSAGGEGSGSRRDSSCGVASRKTRAGSVWWLLVLAWTVVVKFRRSSAPRSAAWVT